MSIFPKFPKKNIPATKPPSFKKPPAGGEESPSPTPASPAGFVGARGSSVPSDELVVAARSPKGGVPAWSAGPRDKLGGVPMLRGLGSARSTLADRIKGLKGRDLAFIGAGLSVLIMAPLAEYLMVTPDDKGASMKPSFSERGPMFSETNPYEGGPGGVGIAPGGLMGQDTDVITPLNVRDPSHLILGPGSDKPSPVRDAPASPPPKPPPAQDNWGDALKAAKAGVTKAVQKAPGLPRPPGKLGGALRGFAALTGSSGGGPSFKLEAPSSRPFFGSPSARSSLTRQSPGAFRSLAGGTGGGTGGGGRFGPAGSGGGNALDLFSHGGGSGGTGIAGGRPSTGDETKNPGGSTNKDSKTTSVTPQENLALLRAKMEMEKAISLKWDKRRYDQLERKKMLEQIAAQTIAQTLQQALLKILDKLLEGKKGNKGKEGGGGKAPGGGGAPKGPAGGPKPPAGGGNPERRPPGNLPTPDRRPPGELPGPNPGSGGPNGQSLGADIQFYSQLGPLLQTYQGGLNAGNATTAPSTTTAHPANLSAVVQFAAQAEGRALRNPRSRLPNLAADTGRVTTAKNEIARFFAMDLNAQIPRATDKIPTGVNIAGAPETIRANLQRIVSDLDASAAAIRQLRMDTKPKAEAALTLMTSLGTMLEKADQADQMTHGDAPRLRGQVLAARTAANTANDRFTGTAATDFGPRWAANTDRPAVTTEATALIAAIATARTNIQTAATEANARRGEAHTLATNGLRDFAPLQTQVETMARDSGTRAQSAQQMHLAMHAMEGATDGFVTFYEAMCQVANTQYSYAELLQRHMATIGTSLRATGPGLGQVADIVAPGGGAPASPGP